MAHASKVLRLYQNKGGLAIQLMGRITNFTDIALWRVGAASAV
jgi:hypothetical protein